MKKKKNIDRQLKTVQCGRF